MLRARGTQATAHLVNVPIEVRHGWPTVLRQAGFDPAPSAFTAEGLLPFLPSAAQHLLSGGF
jgi:O-methyltransferase involved in polyketide biosynthesis